MATEDARLNGQVIVCSGARGVRRKPRLRTPQHHIEASALAMALAAVEVSALPPTSRVHNDLSSREVIEHHCGRPDLPNGIRDSLPGDVRRGAMDGLE
jgi:hypothetical protein